MTRTEAREFMMQVFFQMEACGDFDVNSRTDFMSQEKIRDQKEYCNELHSLLCNKKDEVDDLLRKYSTKWKIERIPKTDLAVLRLAVCEMRYGKVPAAVSINEAVDLAKKYGTDDSGKYVNGILGRIAEELAAEPAAVAYEEEHA
ncbi:MAG: transcription antitermination factor NusB [Emergencia sp.]|jgi:N utilization substance protein B|uniref:Transcription antitermination protein NusB n=1 Tax=Anaerotruncus colihominis TaxID=169435 RepID=A0A845QI00_9FIRM|nr:MULTISPECIES: transcription antitermination factor NusB [Anaerotruncus]MCI9475496.1 transcription antitermination factor NusB [Emergencia sp.]MCI9641107.1 transcription antitermination factor NusB [Emergencia sp.]NBH61146.1 transcription antitermination factor NusB [Anaerotruncus colihominis]NCF01801.1 transcription antitermination factor NusB [Anaerotruncus sp. 80]